jgi:protein-S-isoprenylcysteine O-methyltransferase Ste14
MFWRKLIIAVVWNTGTYGAVLFLTAGTLDWWRAWVLLGVFAIATVSMLVGVLRTRPGLLQERYKRLIQKGQPLADRIVLLVFVVAHMVAIAFIAMDVFQLHLLPKPGVWVSSMGMVLIVAGWVIVALVFRENAFAAPVVKHQVEREHKVIDTGVYRVVRHPMYAGIFILNVGIALWLESYAGALAAIVPVGLLAVRIVFEERFLREELLGYGSYTERVRYRLIPFVW